MFEEHMPLMCNSIKTISFCPTENIQQCWRFEDHFFSNCLFLFPGQDPDGVAAGHRAGTHLAAIGVTAGQSVSGSIRPRIAGKTEIDLAGLDLTNDQVMRSGISIKCRQFYFEILDLKFCT